MKDKDKINIQNVMVARKVIIEVLFFYLYFQEYEFA